MDMKKELFNRGWDFSEYWGDYDYSYWGENEELEYGRADFVCIGYGDRENFLVRRFDLKATELFADRSGFMGLGYFGMDPEKLYFIKKDLFDELTKETYSKKEIAQNIEDDIITKEELDKFLDECYPEEKHEVKDYEFDKDNEELDGMIGYISPEDHRNKFEETDKILEEVRNEYEKEDERIENLIDLVESARGLVQDLEGWVRVRDVRNLNLGLDDFEFKYKKDGGVDKYYVRESDFVQAILR